MKTRKQKKTFLLPKKYTRKSHHKNTKKQKGGFFLESAAIILGMKYILNRNNINEEWKTGKKPVPKIEKKIVSAKPLRDGLTTAEVRNLIDPARQDIEERERERRQEAIVDADDDDIDATLFNQLFQ